MTDWRHLARPDVPYAEVIGDPVAHSRSPVMHAHWLKLLELDAIYRAARVPADGLADYFRARAADPLWCGCNVTIPHKVAAASLVARVEGDAPAAGAVNTVVPREGSLVGHNTDVAGILAPLDRPEYRVGGYPNHVATYAQVIGTGGAARAAGVALSRRMDLEFYSREAGRAAALAAEFGLPESYGLGLDALGPIRNDGDGPAEQRYSHVVVNASPMGMAGKPEVPVDLSRYHDDTVVFDMVYAPVETGLLRAARDRGLRTIGGLEMLVAQGAAAFEYFFCQPAPREHDAALMEQLAS